MTDMWRDIFQTCEPVAPSPQFPNVYVTTDSPNPWHWLIGRYRDLRRVATELRSNGQLCDELWKSGVRFGFRVSGANPSDRPPVGLKRQGAYGDMKSQAVKTDFRQQRTTPVLRPVSAETAAGSHRYGDEFSNVKSYWITQTPQAHHIVEFNNLEALGLSTHGTGDLDYHGLPCVLLMAEFHQRYISSVLKPLHGPAQTLAELEEAYKSLYYQSACGKDEIFPFRSLWDISKLVFEAARKKLPSK